MINWDTVREFIKGAFEFTTGGVNTDHLFRAFEFTFKPLEREYKNKHKYLSKRISETNVELSNNEKLLKNIVKELREIKKDLKDIQGAHKRHIWRP